MDTLFELLFHAWVPHYRPDMAPDYLQDDPVQAYGLYSFRRGFQLGLCLAAMSLREYLDEKTGAGVLPAPRQLVLLYLDLLHRSVKKICRGQIFSVGCPGCAGTGTFKAGNHFTSICFIK